MGKRFFMESTFDIEGLPELNARLDKIATLVAGPIAREALEAGAELIKNRAMETVHRLTGALASDIVVIVRLREEGIEKYAVIGPGWDPDAYRRIAKGRGARSREARPDQSSNPGIYGYFLEVGHRAPGQGLAHNQQYKRAQAALRKQGKRLNTYTNPSSREYGHLSTPPYPFLEPAMESERDKALQAAADVIEQRLSEQGL